MTVAAEIVFATRDIRGLELAAKSIGGLTNKHLSPAVRQAMKPVLQSARAGAPVDTGALKKGLVLRADRSRVKLKKTYKVAVDEKKSDIFAKEYGDNGKGGKKRAYYPASQEFGFKKKNGGQVPGKHFLKKALESHEDRIPDAIMDGVMKEIQKEWTKQHG